MPTLISDLSSYIWLAVIVSAVFATFDTGERFGYYALASAFAAMLLGLTGLGFYIQCAVFFSLLPLMDFFVFAAEKVMKRKNGK